MIAEAHRQASGRPIAASRPSTTSRSDLVRRGDLLAASLAKLPPTEIAGALADLGVVRDELCFRSANTAQSERHESTVGRWNIASVDGCLRLAASADSRLVKLGAAALLTEARVETLDPIYRAVANENPSVAIIALRTVARFGKSHFIQSDLRYLDAALRHSRPRVRGEALMTVARLGADIALRERISALRRDPSRPVAETASAILKKQTRSRLTAEERDSLLLMERRAKRDAAIQRRIMRCGGTADIGASAAGRPLSAQ